VLYGGLHDQSDTDTGLGEGSTKTMNGPLQPKELERTERPGAESGVKKSIPNEDAMKTSMRNRDCVSRDKGWVKRSAGVVPNKQSCDEVRPNKRCQVKCEGEL